MWGSTYPYNPYPYPWTNHLFQDAPSVAIGLFEGLMRKMADGFAAVRKAELELADAYDPKTHDRFFQGFDYRQFSDDEFRLCPPVVALGGDGAMLDIGFQNVSRLMASGKPLRVVVLDTQVYSNTGGQACTSGFHGQVSDMAAYGAARHGKEEHRKEMSLIAMAHRSTYVLQTSQALPAHLVGGVLRGLGSRHPALFNVYSPCQAEHGLPDSASANAAKLALESRAFPYLVYDPDAGATMGERLSLEGNPALDDDWPTYELAYTDDAGEQRSITLPLTIADWAATEPRFGHHFHRVDRADWTDALVPFHEYLELATDLRQRQDPVHPRARPRAATSAARRSPTRWSSWPRSGSTCGTSCASWPRCGSPSGCRSGCSKPVREGVRQEAGRPDRRVRGEDRRAEGDLPGSDRAAARRGAGRGSDGTTHRRRRARPGADPVPITTSVSAAGKAPAAPAPRQAATPPAAALTAPAPAPEAPPPPAAAAGGRRPRAVDRQRAVHHLRRVHQPQPPDVRLQRQQAGLHQGRPRRHLPGPGQGGRALHGADHPPRHPARPRERADGPRAASGSNAVCARPPLQHRPPEASPANGCRLAAVDGTGALR